MKIYKILLSTKQEIEIDQDDLTKIEREMSSGLFIKVKQGIFNPAYMVGIVPVEKGEKTVVDGYIDEKRGVFIATGERKVGAKVVDSFAKDPKAILPPGDR